MNKLTIINNKMTIDIIIDDYKCIVGNDFTTKDLIEKTIHHYFNKLCQSEYSKENNIGYYILLDEQSVNIKDFDYYYVTPFFDMDLDLKMGSKSLSLAYINSLLENVDYDESFQTISILMNDIFENLDNTFEEEGIMPVFNMEFSKKEFIKLLELEFSKSDCVINNFDLSLHERIRLQLLMIKEVSRKSDRKTFIYLNSPHLREEEIEIIKQIDGLKLLAFENTNADDITDLLVVDKNFIIDTLNENAVFDLCNNYSSHITIDEMKMKILRDHLTSRKI